MLETKQCLPDPKTGAQPGAPALETQLAVLDLLRRLFLGGPSDDLVAFMADAGAGTFAGDDPVLAGLRAMSADLARGIDEEVDFAQRLQAEFTRMFEGPGRMPVVPFASFYLSRSKTLMTQETLAVRTCYLEAGVAVEALNRMPDDYLGAELEFLYFLTQEALNAGGRGDRAMVDLRLDQRRRFVENHFARWVPLLADNLEKATVEAGFRGLAASLRALPASLC